MFAVAFSAKGGDPEITVVKWDWKSGGLFWSQFSLNFHLHAMFNNGFGRTTLGDNHSIIPGVQSLL